MAEILPHTRNNAERKRRIEGKKIQNVDIR